MPIIPNSERTPEQLREMGRRGGIASGRSRRQKKMMRSFLEENYATINGALVIIELAYMLDVPDPLQIGAILYAAFSGLSPDDRRDLMTDKALSVMGFTQDQGDNIREAFRKLERERQKNDAEREKRSDKG